MLDLRPLKEKPSLSGLKPGPSGWADLAVIPLIAVLSIPPLLWFAHNWSIVNNDSGRYLISGWHLVSGQGYTDLSGEPRTDRGPVLPALIGFMAVLTGHDTDRLVWAVRLLAQVNPLLAYFLVKRISGPIAGLLAAALVTLFGYTATTTGALNVDAVLLSVYLLTLLALLAAMRRESSVLAFLSGLLLGASILTKETAFTNLPLALLAALMLGWSVRGMLWHYLGVVLVCLPWWIWVYSVSGQVYLVGRLPSEFRIPAVVAVLACVGLMVVAYTSGMLARFLGDERRRRWTGWFLAFAWTVALSGLLLTTAGPALATTSLGTLKSYTARLLTPDVVIVPALLLVIGYVTWKAYRANLLWRFFALALLFQVPICLLVAVEGWIARQYLLPETLLLCALAALVADVCGTAVHAGGYRGWLGVALAVSLITLLVLGSWERAQTLVSQKPAGPVGGAPPEALKMADWMAENVPAGRNIYVNAAQGGYIAFLDNGRHRWTKLLLDQGLCEPRPNVQERCNVNDNDLTRTPPNPVWLQMEGKCRAISLTMPNLLDHVRRKNSGYLMIAGSPAYPGLVKLAWRLQESGAFEIVHADFGKKGTRWAYEGVVLLKSTGQAPRAIPTQMDARSLFVLRSCERAKGPGYARKVKSRFTNGISVVP